MTIHQAISSIHGFEFRRAKARQKDKNLFI